MTEQDVRALVRDVIARRAIESGATGAAVDRSPAGSPSVRTAMAVGAHLSHGMFALPTGDDACLIEPAVPCTHCGYCRSYGH